MKVALVHDWLTTMAGAEKVLHALYELYPEDLYTFFYDEKRCGDFFPKEKVESSLLQKLPLAKKYHRLFLPLFPFAIEQFDLSDKDLILSSSSCAAKGILTHAEQLHICYCHSPARYAWDLYHSYLGKGKLVRKYLLHRFRLWDYCSSHRVDHFLANSKYVARRIYKTYGRKASVIYPPVDTDFYTCSTNKENFFLTASRLVPYKKIDLIVEAFQSLPDQKLLVIGEGPEIGKIKKKATKNVEIIGYQPNHLLKEYMQKAKGFLFAAEEDFGIIPVEAMSCGTPVIAFGKGGVRESVVENFTGLFFEHQEKEEIREKVQEFLRRDWEYEKIASYAQKFSKKRFQRGIVSFIDEKYKEFFH